MPGLENIVELLSDSFSPAIILPRSNTKIYYSALRHSFQQLSHLPPFCNLVAKDVVLISMSSNPDSIEFIAILAALDMRAVVNPVDDIFTSIGLLNQHLKDIKPKLVICSSQDPKFEWFLEACDNLNIPFYSVQIQMHLRSLQIPKIVRKLSPLVTNQMSNIRPICSVVRAGKNSTLDGKSLRENVKHDQHDLALLLLTKITKKIVPLTHLNILESLELFSTSLSLNANDISLLLPAHNLNLSTSSGLMLLFSAFFSGSTIILLPRKMETRNIWPIIKHFKITWLLADPDFHQLLLDAFRDDSIIQRPDNHYYHHSKNSSHHFCMRFILSTGSKLNDDLLLKMEQKYCTQVLTCYTATEAGFLIATHKPDQQRKLGSCGKPVIPILVLDSDGLVAKPNVIGEILIGGPTVAQSYYSVSTSQNKEISFQGIRYIKTGDPGSLDERGFLTVQYEKNHHTRAKL